MAGSPILELKTTLSTRRVKLWECLSEYDEVGYAIRVKEQSTAVSDEFQRDLFHNVMFNYVVLKGYLEDDEDRKIPAALKERKRTLKPKVVREIIEELTEDYDLPDVEVRKVLIEQLTKEQLLQEEAAERRRLVEEQERQRKAAEEQARLERELEKDRIRQEKAAEKERLRREKEAEEERQRALRYEQEAEDFRRAKMYGKELERFANHLPDQLEKRLKEAEKQQQTTTSDFADAVEELEAAERRRVTRAEQERRRRAAEAERQELAKLEAERLHQEELARQSAEQRKLDEEVNRPFVLELAYFTEQLASIKQVRAEYAAQLAAERAAFEEQRRQSRAKRQNAAG